MFRARPTVAAWCRALAELGRIPRRRENGFRGWLLCAALVAKLRLPAVARFRPGILEKA